jgi:hypothetical protein
MIAAPMLARRLRWRGALALAAAVALGGSGPGDGALAREGEGARAGTDEEAAERADEERDAGTDEHVTPLAGRRLETEVLGREVVVEERDRTNTLAINLGGAFFAPSVGGTTGTPIAAFYAKGHFRERYYRLVASGFVNYFDFAEDFDGPVTLFHFANVTIPVASEMLAEGRRLEPTRERWGSVEGLLGFGYRWSVPPYEVDNQALVGLYYHAGYEYHDGTTKTPDDAVIPPDTYVHGVRLRGRWDGLLRNLMELPHEGFAAGVDLEYLRRDRWDDHGDPALRVYRRGKTRDFVRLSGYIVLADRVPFLNGRHRYVIQGHGGVDPDDNLDRYSAFRLGGGPVPSETDDLARRSFPGASFDEYPLTSYLTGVLEYRYEIAFFIYLHLRVAAGLGAAPVIEDGRLRYQRREDWSGSAGLTTGFLFESQLYFETSYDVTGHLRAGRSGTSFLLMWSMSL